MVANIFALFSSQPSQMAKLQQGAKILRKNATPWVRCTNVTDRQTSDGHALPIANRSAKMSKNANFVLVHSITGAKT